MRNNNNNSHYSKSHSHSFLFFTVGMIAFIALIGLSAIISQFSVAPVSANTGTLIPEDAIRIRIVANSDNDDDQKIKNAIRDDIAKLIAAWGRMPSTHDEARNLIKANLPKLQKHVDAKLSEYGVEYGGLVELAKVPFPEKAFDGTTYAAGNYEALRITLGQGVGVNWWCVLFPPLCLTAATAPDEQKQGQTAENGKPTIVKTQADGAAPKNAASDAEDQEPEAKFFLWEMLKKFFAFLASLFS